MSAGEEKKSGLATAGLVLGIIAVVLAFVPIINNVAFVLGILALVFGIIALTQRRSKGFAIAAVILAIAGMGITLAMQAVYSNALTNAGNEINKTLDDASGKNSESILANDIDVTLGEFTATTGEFGVVTTVLPVEIKNKTDKTTTFTVKIEAVDANGTRIHEDTVYANDLSAGQSQKLEAFTYQSDKADALKTATFKVLTASKV